MTTKIFLASSAELKADRTEFELLINRENKAWQKHGVFLELIVWEDFLDAVSQTRLQDEYDKAIRECDVFVMLFFTKVGKYTEEEFGTAFGQFKATNKPVIYTYFKDAPVDIGSVDMRDLKSLADFREKLKALGHFCTVYTNVEGLQLHFIQQLDKLAEKGVIEFKRPKDDGGRDSYQATLTGDGAIAQGTGAMAAGKGGVVVGGNNSGEINMGEQMRVDIGGAYVGGNVTARNFTGRDQNIYGISADELSRLFAPIVGIVDKEAPSARDKVEDLKAEVAKGKKADDDKVATLVDGIVKLVPGAVSAVVSAFGSPILAGLSGPVTRYVLGKLNSD